MAETYVKAREADGRKDLRYPAAPEPLTVRVYDNHAHLEITDGVEPLSLAEQLDRAEAVGIAGVVQASGDIESSRWAVDAAASDPRVLAAVAIHPNDAPVYAEAGRLDHAIGVIDELAAHPRVRAIGETGLDFFRTGPEGHAAQFEAFEAHIALAEKHGIAMQI
ncbi:MAG: TatD family hydrolase, partial [Microbacterium sp.]